MAIKSLGTTAVEGYAHL